MAHQSTNGSLTATGSVALSNKPPGDASTLVQLSGTYGTVTFVIEGSFDGTNYFALAAIAQSSGSIVTGTISPTDNSTVGYIVPSQGLTSVRARVTAISSGTADFALASGDFRGQPLLSLNNAGSLTMTGLSATIGASTAGAGTTTSDAGALPAGTSPVYPTTAADDTVGVKINASDKVTGRVLFIGNGVSNKILKVYGPTGATINGGSANAAFSSASGKGVIVCCLDAASNTWLAW